MVLRHNNLRRAMTAAVVILASACSVPGGPSQAPTQPASSPTPTLPASNTLVPTAAAPGTLSGRIEYGAPSSPASSLYAVSVTDPQEWYVLELPAADGPLPFSLQVPPGSYQLIARAEGGKMAAALSPSEATPGSVSVDSGQTLSGLLLTMVAPQDPCQSVRVPASPDGRFPAIEPASSCLTPTPQPSPTPEPSPTLTPTLSVPAKPGSLTYEYSCAGGVATTTFVWIDLSNNEDGFRLSRNGTVVADLPANTTTFTDNAPWAPGETLKYTLVAYNSAGQSSARTATFSCQ